MRASSDEEETSTGYLGGKDLSMAQKIQREKRTDIKSGVSEIK